MPRDTLVQLSDGETIKVKALPSREAQPFIDIVKDLIGALGQSTPEAFTNFIADNYERIFSLFDACVVGGPEEVNKISGLDDPVQVAIAVFEVNDGPNLLARLTPLLNQVTETATGLIAGVQPNPPAAPPKPRPAQQKPARKPESPSPAN